MTVKINLQHKYNTLFTQNRQTSVSSLRNEALLFHAFHEKEHLSSANTGLSFGTPNNLLKQPSIPKRGGLFCEGVINPYPKTLFFILLSVFNMHLSVVLIGLLGCSRY
ncbi:hypothetical protein CEXT_423331 [Caerostris extrusa]|uniref:Uncharacterized protein n=1 Tax=Caerostris extrusa TaxID=172846 RepID=A0AAV4W0N0_CAEEX|nr:hypothetical protein CEXT_423331 [Caerostris extrusa]